MNGKGPAMPGGAGERRRDLFLLLGVLIAWLAGAVMVNPAGEFPLNDDWSYTRSVRHLLDTGEVTVYWATASLVAHIAVGALTSELAGFSFTALRLSTALIAVVGLIGVYRLVRDAGGSGRQGVLVVALLGFNPVYFNLAFTYMTDVPFCTWSIWAFVFLGRALTRRRWRDLLLGTLFASTAILVRQFAVVYGIGFAVAAWASGDRRGPRAWAFALGPLLGLVVVGAVGMLGFTQAFADRLSDVAGLLSPARVARPLLVVVTSFVYLGLFLFPLLAPGLASLGRWTKARRRTTIGVAAFWAVVGVGLAGTGRLWPITGNILSSAFSVGTITLPGLVTTIAPWPRSVRVLLTAVGLVGAALLTRIVGLAAAHLWRQIGGQVRRWRLRQDDGQIVDARPEEHDPVRIFAVASFAGYLGLVSLIPSFFDRYLLVMMPLVAVLARRDRAAGGAVPVRGRRLALLTPAAIAAMALLAVVGTRDYLTWNRLRWQAVRHLTETLRVSPAELDAGYEVNGHYLFDPRRQPYGPKGFCVEGDRYLVSATPMPAYRVLQSLPYRRWLDRRSATVFALEREP
jgi:4-amino-4-deoxy-L-arabinose transferase-like glycosyltransferase